MKRTKKVKRNRARVCWTVNPDLRDAVMQESIEKELPESRVVDAILRSHYEHKTRRR